jgi:hypothetical protein
MKQKIINNINLLKEVIKEMNLKVKDEILFDKAIAISISEKISDEQRQRKDFKEFNKGFEKKQDTELATLKQLEVLKKIMKDIPKNISKQEAWKIISENSKKKNATQEEYI